MQRQQCKSQGTWKIAETQQFSSRWNGDLWLLDKKLKIIVLRKPKELQENIHKHLNEIRKSIHEQNKRFSRDVQSREDLIEIQYHKTVRNQRQIILKEEKRNPFKTQKSPQGLYQISWWKLCRPGESKMTYSKCWKEKKDTVTKNALLSKVILKKWKTEKYFLKLKLKKFIITRHFL